MGEAIAFWETTGRGMSGPAGPDLHRLCCVALTACGLGAYAFALGLFAMALWTFIGAAG